jgi:eukaryotic-like serine/threonine-protein kinase
MNFIRRINSGGFGAVDEVELHDGSRFARKTFAPSPALLVLADEQKLRTRFKREAKIQSQLDSQFFMPIVTTDLDAANPFYLMPLAERNLDHEISTLKSDGIVPMQALADILNSLDKLHELGYVHRDLKPQNVLYHDSVWKLSDFGLVLPPAGETTKLTSVHSAWGTAAYCAPEQSLEFGNVTAAADIYAFGCILHDIFVGVARIPYQRHGGPGALGTIIEKCTEFKAADRFHSVAALRSILLPLLASGGATSVPAAAPSGWAGALGAVSTWDIQKFRAFLKYVAEEQQKSELTPVLLELREEEIRHLHSVDPDIWNRFADEYCRWVEGVGFDFGVCDVVARRLEVFFDLGSVEVKAKAMLAAAKLGRSHNRWFVMGRVLKLCGAGLDELLAQRIAIEIMASDATHNFRKCAEAIQKDVDAYHPKIAEVLRLPSMA